MGIAPALMKSNYYDPIAAALKEDLGNGDITTEFFVAEALHASGRIVAHESAVVAGTGDRQVQLGVDVQALGAADEGAGHVHRA